MNLDHQKTIFRPRRRSSAASRRTRFRCGEQLESRQLLAIDVVSSTLISNGPYWDGVISIAVDADENLYLSAWEDYDLDAETWQVSLTKLSPDGQVVWEQRGLHDPYQLRVDSRGCVYVYSPWYEASGAGYDSRNLPVTSGAIQSNQIGSSDGYFYVLDGNQMDDDPSTLSDKELVYATYLGGSANIYGSATSAMAIDEVGNVYLTGRTTSSSDLVVTGQDFVDSTLSGSTDGFISKFKPSATTGFELDWSTYFGGKQGDSISSIAIDDNGNIHVAGSTNSPDFPVTSDAYSSEWNGQASQTFLSRLSPSGELLYSTYFGGTPSSPKVAVDEEGASYVAGTTTQRSFPSTEGVFQPEFAAAPLTRDAFLTKFNAAGELEWSTYYGGTGTEQAVDLVLDGKQPILIGSTQSSDLPLEGGWQEQYMGDGEHDFGDVFVARFNATLTGTAPLSLPIS